MGADEIYIAGFWAGTMSSVFSLGGNWDDGVAGPTNVTVPAGVPNMPVLDGVSTTINNLSLGTGTTLSINGNTLILTGAVTGTGTLSGSSTSRPREQAPRQKAI